MPWLGIEPAAFWFMGQCSTKWATPARACLKFLIPVYSIAVSLSVISSHGFDHFLLIKSRHWRVGSVVLGKMEMRNAPWVRALILWKSFQKLQAFPKGFLVFVSWGRCQNRHKMGEGVGLRALFFFPRFPVTFLEDAAREKITVSLPGMALGARRSSRQADRSVSISAPGVPEGGNQASQK